MDAHPLIMFGQLSGYGEPGHAGHAPPLSALWLKSEVDNAEDVGAQKVQDRK